MKNMFRIAIEVLRSLKHSQGKRFFSETGEDAILFDIFKNSGGQFLDIGAAHPVVGSNTYGLYRRGWTGTGVDLLAEFAPLWKVMRSRDSFLIGAVTSEKGEIEFAKFTNKLLSTIDQNVIKFHKKRGVKYETSIIKTLSIDDLLPTSLSSSENFVLNIDVEGAEYKVLELINFTTQRPKVICIESWSVPWETETPSHKLLLSCNYVLYAYTGLSSFYIARERLNELRGMRPDLSN
jgi:hypothetical protein